MWLLILFSNEISKIRYFHNITVVHSVNHLSNPLFLVYLSYLIQLFEDSIKLIILGSQIVLAS